MSGIYLTSAEVQISLINNETYIGSAVDLIGRFRDYFSYK
jgi:hypothetical protein